MQRDGEVGEVTQKSKTDVIKCDEGIYLFIDDLLGF